MMANRINGILFDLGDTLLEFGKVDIIGLFEAGARLAYDYLDELGQPLPNFATYHRRQNWAIRWSFFKSRLIRREFNALTVLGRLADRMGHRLTPQQTLELAWKWYEPLSRCAKIEPDVPQLLAEFRDHGLSLGVVSNTFVPGQVLDRHLATVGLLDLLPVRVYSCDVGHCKPGRRIYKLAAERTRLEPAQTLFVGDSPKADILGANRAGMISVLKDPTGRHAQSPYAPMHQIRRLGELRDIVAQYNGR